MDGIVSGAQSERLAVKHSLAPIYALSGLAALLMIGASIAGLLYQSSIYPTDELLLSFVPNDVVNSGFAFLLASDWFGALNAQ